MPVGPVGPVRVSWNTAATPFGNVTAVSNVTVSDRTTDRCADPSATCTPHTPLLETFLYVSVFGAALGSRIHTLHGFRYIVFVIPGLIMMAWATNAFSNNASSILQQKSSGRSRTSCPLRRLPGSCSWGSRWAAFCAASWWP